MATPQRSPSHHDPPSDEDESPMPSGFAFSNTGRSPYTLGASLDPLAPPTPQHSFFDRRAAAGGGGGGGSNRAVGATTAVPSLESEYVFMYHAFHAPSPSTTNTPRPTSTPRAILSATSPALCISPRDIPTAYEYEGVPEGLLAAEGATLSASFSMAPSKADNAVATLSSIHLCSTPQNVLVIGDVLGRVELYEETRGLGAGTSTPTTMSQRMSLRHTHQAFVAELDCLKSVHIQEKVMSAKFLSPLRSPTAVAYLAANERNIKLFRLRQDSNGSYGSRRATLPAKAFTGKHQYHIQTLSLCADGETFLSSDDLQVFWWHLEAADSTKAACIADIQPARVDDITEVITAASFHPRHGSLFLIATSSGECRVGDLRDPPSRTTRRFDTAVTMHPDPDIAFEHDEILGSISDAAFLGDHGIVTRDYIGLKLWDARKASAPVAKCQAMGFVVPSLPSLYANDAIFDRFSIAVDNESKTVVTGLYNSCVAVWQPFGPHADTAQYYQGDPGTRNGGAGELRTGEVRKVDLCHETQGPPIVDEDGAVIDPAPKTLSEEDLASKVLNVAISDGGTRIAFTVNDHFFVFKKRLVF